MHERKLGEAGFARYLAERGYRCRYEPDLGVPTRPDYEVTHPDGSVIVCEVEAFETWGIMAEATPEIGLQSRDFAEAIRPLRRKISAAAEQLRPLAGRGIPLVAVLANPLGRPIPFNDVSAIAAMYGDLGASIPLGGGQATWVLDRNGKLTNDHQYLSAVALFHETPAAQVRAQQWWANHGDSFASLPDALAASFAALEAAGTEADLLWVDVIETRSRSAIPLPRHWFDGPEDSRWGPTADGTGLHRIR